MGCLGYIGYMRSGRVKSAAGVGRRWAGRRPGREWRRGRNPCARQAAGRRVSVAAPARASTPPGNSAAPPALSAQSAVRRAGSATGRLRTLARRLRTSGLGLGGVEIEQRLPDRLGHQPAHFGFPMKLHLTLGGVDVDVHGGGVDFQKQAGDGVAPFHQRGVIALRAARSSVRGSPPDAGSRRGAGPRGWSGTRRARR